LALYQPMRGAPSPRNCPDHYSGVAPWSADNAYYFYPRRQELVTRWTLLRCEDSAATGRLATVIPRSSKLSAAAGPARTIWVALRTFCDWPDLAASIQCS